MQKYIEKMTGYKATNSDMTCLGHKFELGKWYEIEGEIKLCKRGFHFCAQPSGPWTYYSDSGARIFKVEAEQVLEVPIEAGADFKLVAKRIRLVEEITPGGEMNTGNGNTGDRNTGSWNTGSWNTGSWNTSNGNTGSWNTGSWNTGNGNTGNGNATNYSSGFFCAKEPKVISFDVQTNLTRGKFLEKYPEVFSLGEALVRPDKINFVDFKRIPGITRAKLAKLHKAHLEARKMKGVQS